MQQKRHIPVLIGNLLFRIAQSLIFTDRPGEFIYQGYDEELNGTWISAVTGEVYQAPLNEPEQGEFIPSAQ